VTEVGGRPRDSCDGRRAVELAIRNLPIETPRLLRLSFAIATGVTCYALSRRAASRLVVPAGRSGPGDRPGIFRPDHRRPHARWPGRARGAESGHGAANDGQHR